MSLHPSEEKRGVILQTEAQVDARDLQRLKDFLDEDLGWADYPGASTVCRAIKVIEDLKKEVAASEVRGHRRGLAWAKHAVEVALRDYIKAQKL